MIKKVLLLWQAVRLVIFVISYLGAQVWIGTGFSGQQGITGRDTVFRLKGTSQLLWIEYKSPSPLPWDTLWVILRTSSKIQGAFRLYRVQNNPRLYRGQIRVRIAAVYIAILIPPRQYRQILYKKRFYVTDAAYPTIASLRKQAQIQAAQTQPPALTDITLEDISVSSEALLDPVDKDLEEKIEEPLIEEDSVELDIPDLSFPEAQEEEDFELEDLGNLDDL